MTELDIPDDHHICRYERCSRIFKPRRRDQEFCKPACRSAEHRRRKSVYVSDRDREEAMQRAVRVWAAEQGFEAEEPDEPEITDLDVLNSVQFFAAIVAALRDDGKPTAKARKVLDGFVDLGREVGLADEVLREAMVPAA